MSDLWQRSLEIILQNQSPSGAYVASPHFPTYHYCWFRDGAFIAYAMDLAGEHASAERFHHWAAAVINRRAEVVQRAIAKVNNGEVLSGADILHTRYGLDGEEATGEEWPNFQLDGFGTWLWALGEHRQVRRASLPDEWENAAGLVADYLSALWQRPCYDCWEEFPDRIHPHTLAAIYGGLQAHARLTRQDHQPTLPVIRAFVREHAAAEGYFVKFLGSNTVDASLLGLATPYRLVEPTDPLMLETAAQIEKTLVRGGGVHRYATDSYYGGGEWVLLTGWLGWYYTEIGEFGRAHAALRWMEAQADTQGCLPEQVAATLNEPNDYQPWLRRWGPIAKPLLWSHAKYIILCSQLQRRGEL